MLNEIFSEQLRKILGEEQYSIQEPMSRHITFRVGGPADYYVRPGREQIEPVAALCREFEIPWMVKGNGSNLLVGDKGVRGLVMELGKMTEHITVEGTVVRAEAGAMLSAVALQAARQELTGMEFASGIPGSIGGAVVMNAGAYGGEMKQILRKVTVLTPEGQEKELSLAELDLGYRHSCIPENRYIVLEAELELQKGNGEAIRQRMAELKEQRFAKQPLEYPSAGSTFKRPEGYFAGRLIEEAGLRGFCVGGAQVSEKHCGFVVNRGSATAADLRQLFREVQRRVREHSGVELELEVKLLGDF